MTLDEALLAEVETARDRLESVEDEVYEARARFHQAVRRLHSAGGSMREIATALAMSHQRIHQIIGEDSIVEVEATSSEVTPHPASSTSAVAMTAAEDACSFCGAPRRELDKLLAAAGRMFICSGCVERARKGLTEDANGAATCEFCGSETRTYFEDCDAIICENCVATCERLLATDEPKRTTMRRSKKIRCSFCNTSQREVSRIICGPGVYICAVCVPVAQGVASTGDATPGPRSATMRDASSESHACNFCGKTTPKVRAIVKGGRARICNECLSLCVNILEEEQLGS